MKIFKNLLMVSLVSIFAFSAHARTLTSDTFAGHQDLKTVATSLQLGADDWPESEDSVIRHCLQNLKERDQKKPNLRRDQRIQFLDDCAAQWTTIGAVKDQYSE